MGKDFGPKQVAKMIKAKGLLKLRWYCQMCQKQCRDENGFKCHLTSESHQRMMLVFSENPESFLDDFSKEFEKVYMDLVSRRWKTKRVNANKVYNELIQDRHHIHMNSTKWATLAEFVAHLGKTGQVEVEETPKGYFIKYIDRDPAAIARQEAIKKKEKMDMDDEARAQRRIDAQMAALREYTAANGEPEDPLIHNNDNNNTQEVSATETPQAEAERKPEDKIAFSLQLKKAPLDITKKEEVKPDGEAENEKKRKRAEDDSPAPMSIPTPTAPSVPKKAKLSALDEIKLQQEAKKEKEGRKDYWLHTGIVVKILNKTLKGGALYKQKAIVSSVEERYIAVLRTIDGGLKLKMDQQELETVLPARGGKVLIVNGAYRGDEAVLVDIDTKEFKASVKIDSGLNKGERIMKNYEDVCKLASPEEMK